MPSVSVTPLSLSFDGGSATFEPARTTIRRLRLAFTGGSATMGPGTGTNLSVTTPTLNRAQRQIPIGEIRNGQVYIAQQEQLRQQRMLEAIEAAFEALTEQVNENTALLARIQAAQDLAAAANDNASSALSTINIANSYTDPVSLLTAANTGSITIAAHERVYGDGTRKSVDAGSLSGFLSGDYVTVYYVDAGREGGAVNYQGTTNAVAQSGDVHVVGQVTIPAAGEASTTGTGVTAPGYTAPSSPTRDVEYEQLQ